MAVSRDASNTLLITFSLISINNIFKILEARTLSKII